MNQAEQLVRRLYDEGFLAGNQDVFHQVIARDYVNHSNPDQVPGPEGVRRIVPGLRAAFDDLTFTFLTFVVEGERVAVYGRASGTHTGSFNGLPATQRRASWPVFDLFRVEQGQLAEHWDVVDQLGLLRQLGAVPGEVTVTAESTPPMFATASGEEEVNKALVRAYYAAVDREDEATLDRLVAQDYRHHLGVPDGRDGLKAALRQFRAHLPDGQNDLDDVMAQGDLVVVRKTERGTGRGHLNGLLVEGKALSVQSIDLFRVAGGTLVEHWAVVDQLGLLQQLGVLPTHQR